MLPTTSIGIGSNFLPRLDLISFSTTGFWWGVLGLYVFLATAFFLTILYHWLRYEMDSITSTIFITVNGLVSITLLGGAVINLTNFLN